MDETEPPTRRLVLKPRAAIPSQPGDGRPPGAPPVNPADNLGESAPAEIRWDGIPSARPEKADNPDVPSVFKPKEITPINPHSFPGDESVISVHEMLHRNRVAADETTPELIAMPPRRKARRHRDFALVLGAALISYAVLVLVFIHNLPFLGLATFGVVFTIVILGWIIYGVMDSY